jgi:hypothetical protein
LLEQRIWRDAHGDSVSDDDEDVAKATPSRLIRITVDHVRCEVGLLDDNKANRIVVGDVVRKFMKNRGVRPSHISRQYPYAVEGYFLHSAEDLLLSEARRSSFATRWRRSGGRA